VLQELGFEKLTPIQEKSIPLLLENRDLIGQSQTGSGKTLTFTLPILEKIHLNLRMPQALILCPTRELATQVVSEIRKIGRKHSGLQVLMLVGGQPIRDQIESLQNGAHIIVGTPGRILDLISRQELMPESLQTLVLDEADKMLEMGFAEEVGGILEALPTKRQTLFFSATFPEGVIALSRRFQKNPAEVRIENTENDQPRIEQIVYEAEAGEKVDVLMRVLQQHEAKSTLIFCNQKSAVSELSERFQKEKVSAGALHGDLEQRDRNRVLMMFRNGSLRILVATDIAARGLDIDDLELVINYDLPHQAETYVHRIGRTGRAGRQGTAICLAAKWDHLKLLEIEKATGGKFQRLSLGFKNQHGLSRGSIHCQPEMQTLSISGGRKDKLRPGDILGALTGAGGLKADQIGKIDIQDLFAYVAVSAGLEKSVLNNLRDVKIKGRKFQIKSVQL
jgi:ATP-independent RNA helicase DbpA